MKNSRKEKNNMKVSERLVLFVQDKKGKENRPFKTFSTTISSKKEDGIYINKSMEVRFNTENIPLEKLNKLSQDKCYTLEVEEGWLGVREYQTENEETRKVIYVFVDKATVKDSKPINKTQENSDLPF